MKIECPCGEFNTTDKKDFLNHIKNYHGYSMLHISPQIICWDLDNFTVKELINGIEVEFKRETEEKL